MNRLGDKVDEPSILGDLRTNVLGPPTQPIRYGPTRDPYGLTVVATYGTDRIGRLRLFPRALAPW